MKGILSHCGTREVSREELMGLTAPTPRTESHVPVKHGDLLDLTLGGLNRVGLVLRDEQHYLGKDDATYFSLLKLTDPNIPDKDHGLMVGLRNDNAQRFPASLATGNNVFVCDNGCFWGETKIARRHTRNVYNDLPGLVDRAVGRLNDRRKDMDERIEKYREAEFTDVQAHDFIIRAHDKGIVTATRIPKVVKEWREPSYPEFTKAGKTGWRLLNSFTEVAKETNVMTRPKSTQTLTGMFDLHCGLVPFSNN